jgi:hypothetical protein
MDKNIFHNYNNKILFKDTLLIEAPALINDFLIINNLIVLLLDSGDFIDDKNIFCYSFEGKFKWQIAEMPKLHVRNYFTSIYVNENNDLQAYNKNGVEVTINMNDGTFLKKELIR